MLQVVPPQGEVFPQEGRHLLEVPIKGDQAAAVRLIQHLHQAVHILHQPGAVLALILVEAAVVDLRTPVAEAAVAAVEAAVVAVPQVEVDQVAGKRN